MKSTMGTSRMGFLKSVRNVAGSRYFRAMALGALVLGAAALYTTINQGEGATPPAGGEIGQAYQGPTYFGPFYDEAEERYYDEMWEAFIGIPAPSSQTAAPVQAPAAGFRIDPEWERAIERSELIRDYEAMGILWEFDAFGNVVELPGKAVTDIPFAYPDTPYYLDPDWREGQAPEGDMVAPDDAAELAYDELSKSFFGVPGATPAGVLSPFLVALDEAMELAYDEMSRSFFGVPFVAGKEEATMIFDEGVLPGRYKEGPATK